MTTKPRILFVDDEINILQALRRMLHSRSRDWSMEFAQGGEPALASLAKCPADVVVTDMRMPGMDGAELLARVRDNWPQTTRIVLSGHSDHEGVLRSLHAAHQYLMKPCDADVLKNTVERSLAMRALVTNPRLLALVARLNHIPSLPGLYTQLNEALANKDCSARDVGDIVGRDLGFSVKLLQLVNSAFFGLPRSVATASDAAVLLGTDLIRALALGTNVFSALESQRDGDEVRALMDHCLRTGAFARTIALSLRLDRKLVDESFLAGFTHDIGQMVLRQNLPDESAAVVAMVDGGLDREVAETRVFGATHEVVTAYLLGTWGLPHTPVEAIAHMHRPSACPNFEPGPLTAVHVAEILDREMHGGQGPVPEFDTGYLQRLGLHERLPEWRALLCSTIAERSRP